MASDFNVGMHGRSRVRDTDVNEMAHSVLYGRLQRFLKRFLIDLAKLTRLGRTGVGDSNQLNKAIGIPDRPRERRTVQRIADYRPTPVRQLRLRPLPRQCRDRMPASHQLCGDPASHVPGRACDENLLWRPHTLLSTLSSSEWIFQVWALGCH